MKRSELKEYSGSTVEIIVDDKPAIADLHAAELSQAYLTVPSPAPKWRLASRYYLTDEDAARISVKGHKHLTSAIRLKTDGDGWTVA